MSIEDIEQVAKTYNVRVVSDALLHRVNIGLHKGYVLSVVAGELINDLEVAVISPTEGVLHATVRAYMTVPDVVLYVKRLKDHLYLAESIEGDKVTLNEKVIHLADLV